MKILAAPLTLALAAVLFGSPLSAVAGNKVATSAMQVSFVVQEACTVQTATSQPRATGRADTAATTATTAPAPVVACELKTPYLLTRGDQPAAPNTTTDRPAAPIRTESGAQNWVVYF